MPPDAEVGGDFKVVATLCDNQDGTLTLKEIDGSKLGGGDDDKKDEDDAPKPRQSMIERAKEAGYQISK